jgi:hypothetical protein
MGVSLTIVLVIAGVLLATALGILVALRVLRRRRDEELLQHGAPALVVPIAPVSVAAQRPHLAHHVTALRTSPRSSVSVVSPETPFEDHAYEEEEVMLITDGSSSTDTTLTAFPRPQADAPAPRPDPSFDSGALQYQQQSDEGTLEFLPGRLEVVGGTDQGQEIHFVRPPDGDVPMVTFGRSEGPPHRHVRLRDRTVSRLHARMIFDRDRWNLTNLSRTNPIFVNGVSLSPDAPPVTLADGDRIEMGAVVFVFRAR